VRKHDPFWRTFNQQRIAKLVSPLDRICGLFEYPNLDQFGQPNRYPHVGVVAAAGNDRKPDSPWPPARYPAAHPSVLGVGALKHDGDPTEYSNRADIPPRDGIVTFGGDSQGVYSDQTNGVVGAYIGSFPDGSPNHDGLASWAGTSFAAPRISGSIAALMSAGHTFASALDQLRGIVNDPLEIEIGQIV
jgi:subtilisin family serine protease